MTKVVFDNNHMLQIKIDYQNRDQKNPPQNIEGVEVFPGVYEGELEGATWPQLPDRSWVEESRVRNATQ